MDILVLSKIKHNGTVYEKGSTILNISKKDAERLIRLKVAEEIKYDLIDKFAHDEESEDREENSETDFQKILDENPKQDKKKK